MAQQASLIKLKEKIEAAKRSLSDMPSDLQGNGDDQPKTQYFESDEHQTAAQKKYTPTNEAQYDEKTGSTEYLSPQAKKPKSN